MEIRNCAAGTAAVPRETLKNGDDVGKQDAVKFKLVGYAGFGSVVEEIVMQMNPIIRKSIKEEYQSAWMFTYSLFGIWIPSRALGQWTKDLKQDVMDLKAPSAIDDNLWDNISK